MPTDSTLITTPYDATTDADEIVAGLALPDHRIIVTGGASGIGVETARSLARTGAEVTLAVRDTDAGDAVAREIAATTGNDAIHVAPLDLSDQASVAAFVRTWDGPLDVLVNNAGVMARPLARTEEGWEMQFATNHLGHFALATGLHGALAAAGNARVVAVSSSAHHRSGVVFDDIMYERRDYEPWEAYGQSKSANVLFAVEGAKRWAGDGITINALMPGGIQTNLQRYVTPEEIERLRAAAGGSDLRWKTTQQGAATSVLLAVSPLVAGVSGRYFEDCHEAARGELSARNGVAEHALDPAAAARLWDVSLELIGQG